MLPLRNPDIEEPDAQVMFTTVSLPVLVTAPPTVSDPLMAALPEAVSEALFSVVALIFSEAPVLMVRFLHTPVAPESTGWFAGADGMITSSVEAGAPAGDQFVEVFQAVLVAPVQVFWAKRLVVKAIAKADKIIVILFIVVILYE